MFERKASNDKSDIVCEADLQASANVWVSTINAIAAGLEMIPRDARS